MLNHLRAMTQEHIEEVKRIVKVGKVLTEQADLYSYSFDASFGMHVPDVVIQTKQVDELVALVRLANKEKIPVYPRGLATCLSGGPLPVKGGMVFDLSVMDDVLEIREDDLMAVVSPGVITAKIHKAAEQKMLMYPPDPSSSNVSTIGGNLAENSGGPRGLKYGVTKDYVLGLEVITPEGNIIRTGGYTVKNVTGYDLTKLIVGSEGTLGIITKAFLSLIPKPPTTETIMGVFDNLEDSGCAI
ncbi:FAD-binding oxidoreductase, partial [Brevibacillus porteri]|uniref:FAD-binding oxidoreductase n=1 Tax=Brevibacillus porteri TaxID=2126350 RepID=UPI00363B5FF7